MHRGWYQIAYERDLRPGLNALMIGGHPVLAVYSGETGGALEVFGGTCPHRGARLGVGGRIEGDHVVCPFHGYPIALGRRDDGQLCVPQLSSLLIGGLAFARLGDDTDCGFTEGIRTLDASHYIAAGFTRVVGAPAELVIENAFDGAHFRPVHQIGNVPTLQFRDEPSGQFVATGNFQLPVSQWQGSVKSAVPFMAVAFSPTLVLSHLGGAHPYAMLTATLPLASGGCEVRLSVLLPAGEPGEQPPMDGIRFLLRQAEAGIAKDQVIWEGVADGAAIRHAMPSDDSVIGFRTFCERFR